MDAYREAILKDIGIDRFVIRSRSETSTARGEGSEAASETPTTTAQRGDESAQRVSSTPSSRSPTTASDASTRAPGPAPIRPSRVAKPTAQPATDSVEPKTAPVRLLREAAWESMDLTALQAQVAACEQCDLSKTRQQTVFGSGSAGVEVMMIGDAPGPEDEAGGEALVGRSGALLTKMLHAIGLTRDHVYLTNLLKCRTVGGRDPHAAELSACSGYLLRQIELIKPKLIVCLGRIAAHQILATDQPLNQLRGQVVPLPSLPIPVIVTYHPNYLLRAPREKAKAWDDLKRIQATLKQLHSPQA